MIDDQWWIFSEAREPVALIGNLFPRHADGLKNPWAYRYDRKSMAGYSWFEFVDFSRSWQGYTIEHVPKQYRAALLLLPKPKE